MKQMNARLKWMKIFDKSAKLPETKEEVKTWWDRIDGDLSPENLHCDGEISASAARAKARKLNAELRELEAHARKHGLVASARESRWVD